MGLPIALLHRREHFVDLREMRLQGEHLLEFDLHLSRMQKFASLRDEMAVLLGDALRVLVALEVLRLDLRAVRGRLPLSFVGVRRLLAETRFEIDVLSLQIHDHPLLGTVRRHELLQSFLCLLERRLGLRLGRFGFHLLRFGRIQSHAEISDHTLEVLDLLVLIGDLPLQRLDDLRIHDDAESDDRCDKQQEQRPQRPAVLCDRRRNRGRSRIRVRLRELGLEVLDRRVGAFERLGVGRARRRGRDGSGRCRRHAGDGGLQFLALRVGCDACRIFARIERFSARERGAKRFGDHHGGLHRDPNDGAGLVPQLHVLLLAGGPHGEFVVDGGVGIFRELRTVARMAAGRSHAVRIECHHLLVPFRGQEVDAGRVLEGCAEHGIEVRGIDPRVDSHRGHVTNADDVVPTGICLSRLHGE